MPVSNPSMERPGRLLRGRSHSDHGPGRSKAPPRESPLGMPVPRGLLRGTLPGVVKDPWLPPLSDEQRRVLDLLAKGRTNRETAAELGLSVDTVWKISDEILEKLRSARPPPQQGA